MAVYAISDVHGALDELKRLLVKIDFRYDGSDELYLLGDYCDWGAEPLEALRFCMSLDQAYPFVHCLMGNHEWMFLDAILSMQGAGSYMPSTLWLDTNRGRRTWEQYQGLSWKEQVRIRDWLLELPYSVTADVGGKTYLLAHAYPYFPDMKGTSEEDARRRKDAVWRRLMIREDPFGFYDGPLAYDHFVCGHTITEYYFYRLRYEKDWPTRKPDPSVRNRIFKAEKFTDIDCGAKCLTCGDDPSAALRRGAMRAQLSCLRLDDGHEFYVHPVKHRTPGVIPGAETIDRHIDNMNVGLQLGIDSAVTRTKEEASAILQMMPEVKLPSVKLPSVKIPEATREYAEKTLSEIQMHLFDFLSPELPGDEYGDVLSEPEDPAGAPSDKGGGDPHAL